MKPLSRVQHIGLYVIITLIAIYLVINYLKGEDLFNKKNTYYAIFENVEGLAATGPVYIRGLKVGTVESIRYDHKKDYFAVKISVKSDYALPENSVAEIYSPDILSGKAIRIELGTSNQAAAENDTLASKTVPDIITMLTGELLPLKEQASEMLINLNTSLKSINAILDEETQADLKQSFANLNRTLNNAERISRNLDGLAPELDTLVGNLKLLSQNLNDSGGNLQTSLHNLNTITTGLSEADLKGTLADLRSLLKKLQDPNGTVGKLLSTDQLHGSIDSLLQNINTLVEKITENPKKYIKISVF